MLQLGLRGYNHKQHVLLQRIMEKMVNFKIDPQRFDLLLDNVSLLMCFPPLLVCYRQQPPALTDLHIFHIHHENYNIYTFEL